MPSRGATTPEVASGSSRPVGVRLERCALERLYDASPEPVVLVELERHQLLYCNQTFMDLCGLRPHAARRLMRRGVRVGEVLQLEDASELEEIIHRAARLDQALGASSMQCRALAVPGGELVLTVTAAPIDAFCGAGAAVLVTFRNTTAEHRVQVKYQRLLTAERQHAEELEAKVRARTRELAETQDELLQASRLAAVGEVAGAAAHEVFNPLTAIAGNLENLRSALVDEADSVDELKTLAAAWREAEAEGGSSGLLRRLTQREDGESGLDALVALTGDLDQDLARRQRTLDMLCNASHRIERIVQGMLGMSGGQAEPEILELAQVFREVRDLMSYSFDRAGVGLDMRVAGRVYVYADRGELLQVLTNLLRNGCQAANQVHGTKGGRVSATAEADAQTVRIRVEDNGVGVPEDVRPRIFESGFTTKRRGEGSGLGLPISRRLIRRNGGDLLLQSSNPGQGTTMLVSLPSVQDERAEEDA